MQITRPESRFVNVLEGRNILDARCLPVNRLAIECIQRVGKSARYGQSALCKPRRVVVIVSHGATNYLVLERICRSQHNFCGVRGNNSRSRFLQDREVDCQIETKTNFCFNEQGTGTRQPSWRFMNVTGYRFFVSLIGSWDR